jgi:hypothetical protein
MGRLGVPALLVLLAAGPAAAQSQTDQPAEDAIAMPAAEATRPWFGTLGIGVGVRLDGSRPAAFRILEEIGIHLDGVPVGPFFAIVLAEDISSYYSMQIGVRAGWDIEILRRDFSIVLSPSLGVTFAFDVVGSSTFAFFCPQPALGVGLLLLDRMLAVWIRPIGVDVYIGDPRISGGWAAAAGASLAF